jgi:predicted histidine transporter YuiF (NhaC family)
MILERFSEHKIDRMIAESAIKEGLDPFDVIVNGFPVGFCQKVNEVLASQLKQARDAGEISDYVMVAKKIGPIMAVSIKCQEVGHIEKFHCTMEVGTLPQ